MNRTSLTMLLALSMTAAVGCSSKNYVRQQTTPLINKTNELDDMTAKNSRDIKMSISAHRPESSRYKRKPPRSIRRPRLPDNKPDRPRPQRTTLFTA